jgi:2-dehydro-3-deoxyphosphogluconate aldolase/(4S)-4-hydroxy-2-oxoglutarate aldolase
VSPYETVTTVLANLKVVPVVSLPTADRAVDLADALAAGGLPIAEVTFRTAAAAESIDRIRESRPDVLVGAGTVLDVETARIALDAGAQFAVTPGFNPRVVDFFLDHGVPIVPGASTPTEIDMAMNAGLTLVKFFPAEASGGVGYLKAVSAPYSSVRFMPTGGVTLDNIPDYLALPSVMACGGTWLAGTDLIAAGDFDRISANVRAVHERVTGA